MSTIFYVLILYDSLYDMIRYVNYVNLPVGVMMWLTLLRRVVRALLVPTSTVPLQSGNITPEIQVCRTRGLA